jgi:DNA-binding XRE family transcriptional regulator
MTHCTAANAKPLRHGSAASRRSDRSGFCRTGGIGDILHTDTVENFSTLSSLICRSLLYMQPARYAVPASAMSDVMQKQRVGERLRIVREAQGKGLREFARMHDIDHTSLNQWEKGKSLPSQAYLRKLWEHYQIGPNWLYLGIIAGLPYETVVCLQAAEAASPKLPSPATPAQAGGPDS